MVTLQRRESQEIEALHTTPARSEKNSSRPSRLLLLMAIVLAYATQLVCFPTNLNSAFYQRWLELAPWFVDASHRMVLGALGYALALGLFAWVAPSPHANNAPKARGAQPSPETGSTDNRRLGIRAGQALMVASGIFLGASLVRFALMGEDALTRGLWLGSVGLLLLGSFTTAIFEERPYFQWREWKGWRRSPHLWAFVVLMAGAAWLRFHQLDAIPQDLHGDMASMGLQAREILAGTAPALFRQGWADIPMLGFYPTVVGLAWVSNSILGLNAIPALEGLLTIVALYFLVLRLFAFHRLAALAAVILAINIPHLHFSRLAAYMDPWPWILFGFLFLAHGLKKRRLWAFPLAGWMFGMSMQMYYSGRALIIILPVAGVYLSVLYWRSLHREWRYWLGRASWLALGMVVALGPIMLYFLQHPGPLLERSRSVFLFHEPVMTHLMGKYHVDSQIAVVWEQIKRSVLMFNATHDTSTQFGYTRPMFSAALSPLVLLGIGYSFRHWRRPAIGFGLIWLGVMLVTGSVLTNNAPFWPRLVGILPVAAWMAALALYVTLRAFQVDRHATASLLQPSATTVITLALATLFFVLGQRNWKNYVEFTINNAHPEARIGRFLDQLPDDINACSFSTPYKLSTREIAFLAWPRLLVDLEPGMTGPLLESCPGPLRVWILGPEEPSQRLRLERRWPDGQLQEHRDGTGRVVFLSYLITNEAVTPETSSKEQLSGNAYLPNGTLFVPQYVFRGDTSSHVVRWRVGPVEVTEGALTIVLGPIPDHDAVFDYIELLSENGTIRRYEAESLTYDGVLVFADRPGADNHWWRQQFAPFSGGVGLVAQKNELVPALKTTIPMPSGLYDLTIGTFTGDPANGVFALGVAIE